MLEVRGRNLNRNTVNRRPKVFGDEGADGVTSLVPGVKDSRPQNSRAYTIVSKWFQLSMNICDREGGTTDGTCHSYLSVWPESN